MQSLAEHLTARFYDWEMLGRGWQVYEVPLMPEPPFRPFFGHYTDGYQPDAVDDGRQPSLTRELLRGAASLFRSKPTPEAPPDDEPELRIDRRSEVQRIEIVVPEGVTYPREQTTQFILNLAQCRHVVCLEFLGAAGRVSTALVVDESDVPAATTQLQSHFPDATVVPVEDDALVQAWEPDHDFLSLELGLAQECMLPLQSFHRLDPDPLNGLIGCLGSLGSEEWGIVQVYFCPLEQPWAASIRRAVTSPDGSSFFANDAGFVRSAADKISSPLYGAVIRVASQSSTPGRDREIARSLVQALKVADAPGGNELIPLQNDAYEDDDQLACLISRASMRTGMLLSLDELLTFVHLPGASVASPALVRQVEKTKPAPAVCASGAICLGENQHHGQVTPVYQTLAQRARHTYVLGATGSGKSTLLLSMIAQDLEAGRGVGVLDPHGDLIDDVLARVPEERLDDVILLDLADEGYPVPFNILHAHTDLEKNLLAGDLAAAFRRLATSWGDQMTAVLSNAILAILESKRGGTLADLRRFLVEKRFREEYLQSVEDEEVLYYWQHEFSLTSGKPQGSVVTRLNTFLRPKPIRYMVAHGENRLDMAAMMDHRKIFLARLPQGAIGEENAHLLGTLIVSAFHRAALARQDQAAESRTPFYLYIDEFHHFITPSMSQVLSGARKYALALVLAHQELRQLESRDADVASAVMSNPATQILFRLGDQDAKRMESRLESFTASDLESLPVGHAVARVERATWDFNLSVPLPPEVAPDVAAARREAVRERSRSRYAVPREEVQERLRRARPQHEPEEEKPRHRRKRKAPRKTEPDVGPVGREVRADVPSPPPPKPAPPITASTPKPTSKPKEPSQGRGGLKHKAIQRLIKQWAEGMGYRAEREKTILDGRGAVDVLLTKGDVTLACEISVTTPTKHELQNLTKCFQAGFDQVVMVSEDPDHLEAIRERTLEVLDNARVEHVRFLLPQQLFRFIEEMEEQAVEPASEIRGYKVSINRAELDAGSRAARMTSVKRTIARASVRRKSRP